MSADDDRRTLKALQDAYEKFQPGLFAQMTTEERLDWLSRSAQGWRDDPPFGSQFGEKAKLYRAIAKVLGVEWEGREGGSPYGFPLDRSDTENIRFCEAQRLLDDPPSAEPSCQTRYAYELAHKCLGALSKLGEWATCQDEYLDGRESLSAQVEIARLVELAPGLDKALGPIWFDSIGQEIVEFMGCRENSAVASVTTAAALTAEWCRLLMHNVYFGSQYEHLLQATIRAFRAKYPDS